MRRWPVACVPLALAVLPGCSAGDPSAAAPAAVEVASAPITSAAPITADIEPDSPVPPPGPPQPGWTYNPVPDPAVGVAYPLPAACALRDPNRAVRRTDVAHGDARPKPDAGGDHRRPMGRSGGRARNDDSRRAGRPPLGWMAGSGLLPGGFHRTDAVRMIGGAASAPAIAIRELHEPLLDPESRAGRRSGAPIRTDAPCRPRRRRSATARSSASPARIAAWNRRCGVPPPRPPLPRSGPSYDRRTEASCICCDDSRLRERSLRSFLPDCAGRLRGTTPAIRRAD
jgi:hypothetical protein